MALVEEGQALDVILQRVDSYAVLLGDASVNPNHVRHLGRRGARPVSLGGSVDWLNLIGGAPIAAAKRLSTLAWPRLAGSDLMGTIPDHVETQRIGVGSLGGSEPTLGWLSSTFARARPNRPVVGLRSPSREEMTDPHLSKKLAKKVRAQDEVQLPVVGFGKPRKELWIENYAEDTGARVLLAFEAAIDCLACRLATAPGWVVSSGIPWAWRLALASMLAARRYLIQGPPARLESRKASLADSASPVSHDAGTPSKPAPLPYPRPEGGGDFVVGRDRAQVATVIVTYNSADDVTALIESLRMGAGDVRLRVIVADNDSKDSTLDLLAAHSDVTVIRTGGNLGYSGGINAALQLVPPGEHVLVLNPDLKVRSGAIRAMVERLLRSGAGLVAPMIVDPEGDVFPSIRREPSLLRALGDAAFGSRFKGRHGSLSDIDTDPSHYGHPHPVEWASGAALLIHENAVSRLGSWDERFFLYSEEIDFQRRARAGGFQIWYEPAAVVEHRQGGSGVSSESLALMAVNRVRYVEKYHGPVYSAAYRIAVMLHELARSTDPAHRKAFSVVADRGSWDLLPQATFRSGSDVAGSIIIPARNEAVVIGRTLSSLGALPRSSDLEMIVVCNGTTDDTASIARCFPGVQVAEIPMASKVAALNLGDRLATKWPRLYLDADIKISPASVRAVLSALSDGAGGLEAARPPARYDTRGASFLVRRYYRARSRIAGFENALWEAGAYAVSEAGHTRFAEFPEFVGDDLFVDRLFPADTRSVVTTEPVVVRTPRDLASLSRILRRGIRVNTEQPGGASTREIMSALVRSVRGPASLLDALVYAGIAASARLQVRLMRERSAGWEQDVSPR